MTLSVGDQSIMMLVNDRADPEFWLSIAFTPEEWREWIVKVEMEQSMNDWAKRPPLDESAMP